MVKFHDLTVADIRAETDESVSIAFAVPEALKDAYSFTPGQFLTLRAEVGGEDIRRSYSICSGVNDNELRVAVKRVGGGRFSGFANSAVAAGDVLQVMTPDGRFTLAPDPALNGRHVVAFAAGSGITPIMSIVKSLLEDEPETTVTLFYGNRTVGGVIFRDALEALKDRFTKRFTLVHLLSGERQEAPLLNGRLDGEKAATLLRVLVPEEADAYLICGPGTMVEDIRAALRAQGVAEGKIRFELFTPADGVALASVAPADAGAVPAEAGDTAKVAVLIDGVRTEFDLSFNGPSVLEGAEAAGADAPFSCKGGVCATCRARVLEGAVEMAQNFALLEDEVAQGFVLTCQSRPTSKTLVLDYDAV